ncbi:MAG: FAD-binding protein [Candidatus Gastranaerophilales bacterium]|nr:FAD-binding protein [Candidatus Gastranaerophilales bacterium]
MLTKTRIKTDLEKILPKKNILSTPEECYVYAQDGTNGITSKVMPDAAVFPETIEEVCNIMRFANEHKIPVVARGAGTNLVGACIPEKGGIVLNFTKMNKILEINKTNMTARVQAGAIVGKIQNEAEKLGLFFPPDPSNMRVSTIGGAIAQSAGGPKTFKYGTTRDYILALKVVLSDGSIIETGSNTIKNATGYHLEQLFIGSEGTLGIVVEAILKLIPKPETTRVVLAYFDDVEAATLSVNKMIEANLRPSTIDFMNKNTLGTIEKFYPAGLLTDKEAALIIEIDGFEASMHTQIKRLEEVLAISGSTDIIITQSKEEQERIWTSRRASFAATAKLKPDVISNDLIVPRENISKLVSGVDEICSKYGLPVSIVGHIGDGNIHPQIALDLNNEEEARNYEKAKSEMYDLTLKLNGTLSAEHGIGSEKRMFMEKAVDNNTLDYMKKIKKVFDPNNILNPDKIFNIE